MLDRALGLWRGPALADVAETQWARPEVVRLEEMRLDAVDLGLAARLAAGQSAEVVALAEAAVAEHPLRENLWAHLIAALYRQGRQADALQAFQRLRRSLVEDLGIEPSVRLADLEQAVLLHQPGLDRPLAATTVDLPAALPVPARSAAVLAAVAPLPAVSPEVLIDRPVRLGATANRVLATATVIGASFAVPFLAQVAELPEADILNVLDAARQAHLVVDAGYDHFEFVDAVVFQAFSEQLGPTRRARIHRRIAGMLQTDAAHSDPRTASSRLTGNEARHWLAGGRPEDLAEMVGALLHGAEEERNGRGPAAAGKWLDAMLAVIRTDRGPRDPAIEPLLLAFATACRIRRAGSRDRLGPGGRGPDLASDDPERLLDAALTTDRGLTEPAVAIAPELLAAFGHAAQYLTELNPGAGARHLALVAAEMTWTGVLADRMLIARQAVDAARRSGDPTTFATVVAFVGPALALPSTLPWRLDLTAEAMVAARSSQRTGLQFFCAFARLQCVTEAGDGHEAQQLLDLLDAIAGEEADQPLYAWAAMMWRTWHQVLTGDLESAGTAIAAWRALGASIGQAETAVICHRLRAAMAAHEGRAGPSDRLPRQRSRGASARHALDRGDFGAAIRLLQDEAKARFPAPETPDWLSAHLTWAEVTVRLRAAGPAEQLYRLLLPYADHLDLGPLTSSQGAVAEHLGALAGLLGRPGAADRHYRDAIGALGAWPAPFHLVRAQVAWARLLEARTEPDASQRSQTVLREAIATAARFGCDGMARVAGQDLRRQGLRREALAVTSG